MSRALVVGLPCSVAAGLITAGMWMLNGASAGHAATIGLATFLAGSALPLLAADAVPGTVAARRLRREGIRLAPRTLRIAAGLDTVVLDKDGTVTTGALRVVSVDPLDPSDDQNLRWFAGALTHASDDRVARAVSRLATRGKLTDVEVVAGQGVRGSVDRHPVRVGEPQWVGIDIGTDTLTRVGRCVGVEVDGRPLGSVTVGDSIRADAAHQVARLRALGIEAALASTDTATNTRHVGDAVGITRFLGFPDSAMTVAEIAELQREGRRVAYVGPTVPREPGDAEILTICTADSGAAVTMDDLDIARIPALITRARVAAGRRRATLPAAAAGALVLAVLAGIDLVSVSVAAMATTALALMVGGVATM